MKITAVTREYIMEEDRDFDSAHASTLLPLPGERVLAAWFAGSWEKAPDVAIWVSLRQNGSWERPRKVADARGTALWNPVLFCLDENTIVLYYKCGAAISEWKTFFILSHDNGLNWSAPQELVPGDTSGGRGPVKNKPIRLKNGNILAPASYEGELWDAFADISEDNGKTWSKSALVPLRRVGYKAETLHRPQSKYFCYGKGVIQPTLWEDEAGKVHMLLRSTSSAVFKSDSSDGGRTWSTAYATGLPNNNSGLDLVRLPSGTLVVALNPTPNLPNYYKGPRTPLSLYSSTDNGETWQELYVLEDGPGGFSYPAIAAGDKNELHVTYTWKRERIAYGKLSFDEL